jgi:hypothetical protein
MERDFKGVWVSKEIWLNEKLGWSEKLLLVEIDSLAKNGECFASNEHFAKFFGLSKDRISKMVTSLKRKGFIAVDIIYKSNSKEIEKRIIKVIDPTVETPIPHGENAYTPIGENTDTPIGENAIDNNTLSFNNTSINNTSNKNNNTQILKNEFEHLWNFYPKKQDKKRAMQSFLKARKEVSLETIKSGLTNYVQYIQINNIEPQFIKNGSTWFNGQCWNDDYTILQRRKADRGFIGDFLDELDGLESGNLFDNQRANRKNFNDFASIIPESL